MITEVPTNGKTYFYNSASPFLIAADDPRYAMWTEVHVVRVAGDDIWYRIADRRKILQTTVTRFMEIVHDQKPL